MLFMSGRSIYRRFLASTTKLTLYQPMITRVNTATERCGIKRVGKSAGVTKTLKIKGKGMGGDSACWWHVQLVIDQWQCATCLLLVKCIQCSQDCDSEYLQCLPTSVHLIAQSSLCLMRACDLGMTVARCILGSHKIKGLLISYILVSFTYRSTTVWERLK